MQIVSNTTPISELYGHDYHFGQEEPGLRLHAPLHPGYACLNALSRITGSSASSLVVS
jgi:hypothetical protein